MKRFKSLAVAAALIVAVASVVVASPSIYPVGLTRITYPNGIATPDSGQFTVEFSNASTIATTDTLAPFYVGGLNWLLEASGGTNTNNVIRINLQGVPQLVAGDSVYVWADYSMSKTGPWWTQKTTVAASAILLNGLGAGAADTAGVGTWLTYPGAYFGNGIATGSNSLLATPNVYSGFLVLQSSAVALINVSQPLGWQWCRLRLAGDHGGSAPIYSASVTVSVPTDVAPQVSPGPRQ